MNFKLLTEHHLEFLSLKGGCTGSYESTLVKLPNFLKSQATAHIIMFPQKETHESTANQARGDMKVWKMVILIMTTIMATGEFTLQCYLLC